MKLYLWLSVAILLQVSVATANDQQVVAADNSVPIFVEEETVDEKDWGIRNGCISIRRIDRIQYLTPQTAKVTLRGRKTLLMSFSNRCSDLRSNPAVISSRSGLLCAGMDTIRVHETAAFCLIDKIEPFVELDEVPEKSVEIEGN